VISSAGGTPRRLTSEPSVEIEPSWSHDGRWIYFASDRGGQSHIWKIPFAGGTARQVTQGDGGESLESADGKRLYYFRRDQNDGIWSMPVDGGLEEAVPELKAVKRTRAWTVREEGIYFYEEAEGGPLVRFFNFATCRVSTVLAPERPAAGNPGFDISPDGRQFLYTQVDHRTDGLMMIENFR
jgi:eukaryotic-like serine/threonine-protein kinase